MKYLMIFLLIIGFVLPNVFAESLDSALADIQWKEAAFPSHAGTKATITVTDSDMNKHSEVIDYLWINVRSDSDGVGFRMNLFETNFDSGVFEGDVTFTGTAPSGGGFLHTVDGDTITAKYVDINFPSDYESERRNIVVTEDKIEMFATAIVGSTGPPMERAPASNFMILDIRKTPIENNLITVDQQIRLVSDLENQMSRIQPFAYLVQIHDEQNQVESLSWLTGNLTASQKINLGTTWIPIKEGKYFATVFVWESIDNPTALSPPLPLEISVKNEN
ncbi:MAG: hypothetical protein ACW9W4_01160 [Candidatus Nitrosopumilus sp. bin_7KS]